MMARALEVASRDAGSSSAVLIFDGAKMRAFAGTCFARGISRIVPEIRCRIAVAGTRRAVLTFDDGPTQFGTSELRDVLAQYQVPAVFFLVGENAIAHRDKVRGLVSDGHLVGNHSWTHVDAWRASARHVFAEMGRCCAALEEITGKRVNWVRPPFGRVTRGLVKWCRRNDRQMLLWDVMPPDFEAGSTSHGVAVHLERRIRPGSVICLHDNPKAKPVTADALRIGLPRLLEAGWQFCLPAA
jgi:peptidoglycan-N-acetylglucosamine deacetylase